MEKKTKPSPNTNKETKLFSLIKSISKDEFRELENFILSPAFNQDKNNVKLYHFIRDHYQEFLDNSFSNEEIYRGVFRNAGYSKTKYWKLTSGFSGMIDDFLIYREFSKDIYYRKNLLLDIYRTRNIQKQFETLSKEMYRNFSTDFNKGLSFYLNRTHFYFQKLSYLGPEDIDEFEADLRNMFENLKMFFIMTNITGVSIISNFKENFPAEAKKDIWMFREILGYLGSNKKTVKKKDQIVYIFYLIILMKMDFTDEGNYFEIKKLIQNRGVRLSKNLLRHILINLFDYAVKKFTSGEEKFLREIYFINKVMDDNSVTLFGEFIQGDYFYSVVEHSAMLEEISWAEDFMKKYGRYLTEDYRESAVNLSRARINFESGDFDSSLNDLLKVENLNPYFYLSHKILLLQNLFEKNDYESIDRVLETTQKYINRRIDISDELKKNYLKFFYFFKKLKTAATARYLSGKLLKEISREPFFIYRKWLLSKSRELI
ncbi:MAG: hypothetical protein JSS91_08485 [Bacteroidetes bacterium]|nr:hypothetical protein [Bacteroidota bacterium]